MRKWGLYRLGAVSAAGWRWPHGPNRRQTRQTSSAMCLSEVVRNHVSYDVAADGTYTKNRNRCSESHHNRGWICCASSASPIVPPMRTSDLSGRGLYAEERRDAHTTVPADKIFLSYGPVTAPGFNDFKIKSAVFQHVEAGDEVGVTRVPSKKPWFAGQFYATQVFGQLLAASAMFGSRCGRAHGCRSTSMQPG